LTERLKTTGPRHEKQFAAEIADAANFNYPLAQNLWRQTRGNAN
jgi:hypothetical protein